MTRCIIIEDQLPAQRILITYISDIPQLTLAATFGDPLSALEYLKTNTIDLIFLDIHLPKLSGMAFLKLLSPRPKIILTTAFTEYALDGYEMDVIDYLLKPFSFERFYKAVSKIIYAESLANAEIDSEKSATSDQSDFIFIKTGNDFLKLEIASIQYIKSLGDYTQVFTPSGKHLVSYPLKYWSENLPTQFFCQIHKSSVVNIRHIEKISGNQVFIQREILPIGRTFKDHFFENYLDGF